jgi:short-subunit dehydrogenase
MVPCAREKGVARRPAALITGGTSGIGAAYAEAFAARGYDLVLVGLESGTNVETRVDSLKKAYGVNAVTLRADLSKESEIKTVSHFALNWGEIEVLVNCAGFGIGKRFEEADLRREDAMLKVHCLAPMNLMHSVIPHMEKRGKGVIINVASLSGFLPLVRNTVYGGTKAFLISLTESLHLELRSSGIRVQALVPGFVKTHFHDTLKTVQNRARKYRFFKWMTARQVVEFSLNNLEKGKVVCIPGWGNKFICWLSRIMPRSLFYKLCLKVGKE